VTAAVPRVADPVSTIAGVASAPGLGARAIVRLSGPIAFALVDARFDADAPPGPGACADDGWFRPDRGPPIPCARWRFPGPRSYTGEDCCELHLCGGERVARRVLEALLDAGAASAGPGDFTRRAFEAGRIDLPGVLAVLALIDARDIDRAHAALAGLDGRLARALAAVEAPLVEAVSLLTAALDFADRDLDPGLERRASEAVRTALDACRSLEDATESCRAGGSELPRVVLIGAPNAGKSSLFNALLGATRAVTDARPGTTRDPVIARVELGGVALELADPAGIGEPTSALDEAAMDRARELLDTADLALALATPGAAWPAAELLARAPTVVYVRSQVDTVAELMDEPSVVATSAVAGTGLAALATRIGAVLTARARSSGVTVQARAASAMRAVGAALARAHELLKGPSAATELALFELGEAQVELGRVAGRIDAEDILDVVFARFCIGK